MTNIEYEAKALDIDIRDITRRILGAGGVEATPKRLMRRYVYNTVPPVPGRWVRLRDTGDSTTLCVKEITTDAVDGTRETEVVVDDFTEAAALLRLAGLVPRGYQENRRTSYRLGAVRLEIDEWPRIPPYLEIEGDDAGQVWEAAAALGLSPDRLTSVNTTKVYALYGIDLDVIRDLRFE
ncbi:MULTISPECIES: CYTH domain-containing protein [unclassified Streptomyces]|uniref:CYTH domain-containing protein n=1 Tax=unclassified Streptomyces TaxID=2593676 RepID=UPI00036FD11E|nr:MULTISPECIES: CYTH domain-containing protein [unclassified Streptomyces]MYQ78328.1 CYTH domain-containing protein [Streptomyces sp. SID4923]